MSEFVWQKRVEMSSAINYKPQPVSTRRTLPDNGWRHVEKSLAVERAQGEFSEIELFPFDAGCTAPQPQAIIPVADEKQELFYRMRQIARNGPAHHLNSARVFYEQAVFMRDFEDDYEEAAPFSCYFPYYQIMGNRQLRTYFTWRAKVRRGSVEQTAISYVFLYIYELLNNIGVDSPQDGLDKLVAFWKGYRVCDATLDKYLPQWLKDYHVYYELPESFERFVQKHRLREYYQDVLGCNAADELGYFAGISGYKIKRSAFYKANTRLVEGCLTFTLERLRTACAAAGKRFEDFVFRPSGSELVWIPFERALFYPLRQQPNRQVALSEREVYFCRQNRWKYQTAVLSSEGRRFAGGVIKQMEAGLRQAAGFTRKLAVSPGHFNCGDQEVAALPFAAIIRAAAAEYYAAVNRKPVVVDVAGLNRIRCAAEITKAKLLVPEEENEIRVSVQSEPADQPAGQPATDGWERFRQALTPDETAALVILLQGGDIRKFAGSRAVLLEVLLDGINQKAADTTGDVVLETGDDIAVFAEYAGIMEKIWCK